MKLRGFIPAVLAVMPMVLGAAGCDDAVGAPSAPTGTTTGGGTDETASTGTGEESANTWQDLDPCALLSDAALAEVGIDGLTGTIKDQRVAGRPVCEWGERFAQTHIELMLWQPPIPSIFDEQPTLDVDGRTAYITGLEDSTSSCTLDVDNAEYFVKVTLEKVPGGDAPACDDTAVLAAAVLDALAESG